MGELARTPDATPARVDGGRANPLRLLPEEWREPVSLFYAVHSDYLKGTAGLVARLKLWMAEDGLTLEDARVAFGRLMRPQACAGFQYVGQLLAALAAEVAAVIEDRREKERAAARDQLPRAGPAVVAEFRDELARRWQAGGGRRATNTGG